MTLERTREREREEGDGVGGIIQTRRECSGRDILRRNTAEWKRSDERSGPAHHNYAMLTEAPWSSRLSEVEIPRDPARHRHGCRD